MPLNRALDDQDGIDVYDPCPTCHVTCRWRYDTAVFPDPKSGGPVLSFIACLNPFCSTNTQLEIAP